MDYRRYNQTLEGELIYCVKGKQDDWALHIKRILFGYRTSVSPSTGVNPFTAVFRRNLVRPICLHIESYESVGTRVTTAKTVKKLTERMSTEK